MHTLRHLIQRINLITAQSDSPVYDIAVTMSAERVGALPSSMADDSSGFFPSVT